MISSRSVQPAGNGAAFLGLVGLTTLAALAGGRATRKGLSPWYEQLNKPPFQPPAWLFAPVWTLLYTATVISGWRVYRQPSGSLRRRALRLWALQLGLNSMWSWLFFGRRMPRAALADCVLLFATATEYARVARQLDRSAARLFFPYVAWVGFATILNEEIVRLNPPTPERDAPGGTLGLQTGRRRSVE